MDDSLEQGALGILLNAVSGKKGVAYGRFSSWDPKMEKCLYVHHAVRLKPNPFISLSRGNFSPPGSMLFPSSVFNEIGDFDQDVAGCEDWDFLIRLARAGYSFRRVNKPVFKYRAAPATRRTGCTCQAAMLYSVVSRVIHVWQETDIPVETQLMIITRPC